MKPHPVVLVPGIMGSELLLSGWTVWNDSLSAMRAVLNPALFAPWVPLEAGPPLPTYDSLISWLTYSKGYGPDDLFLFGYDWRPGIAKAAEALAMYVENSVRHGSQIIFVAHSLGCLVVRWAITEGLIESIKVKLVIAAGPPFLGSALAFRSVVEVPDIDPRLNYLLRLAQFVRPSLADQIAIPLTRSLVSLQSLIELMPPETIPVFTEGKQQLFSAFQWRGWPEALSGATSEAGQAQQRLAASAWPTVLPRKLILSENAATETGYFIQANNPFAIAASLKTLPGDGTVLADSARAYGTSLPELVVNSAHQQLLDDADTIQYLDSVL